MSRIQGTNNRQSKFLRAFRKSPAGPPPDAWPSPVILRRWLKNPNFQYAIEQIQHALRLQADLQLSAAACRGVAILSELGESKGSFDHSPHSAFSTQHSALQLLRLSHIRQRFPLEPLPPPPPPPRRHTIQGVEIKDPHSLLWCFSGEIDHLLSSSVPQLQARPFAQPLAPDTAAYLSPATCTLGDPDQIIAHYPGACFQDYSPWRITEMPTAIIFEDDALDLLIPQRGRSYLLDDSAGAGDEDEDEEDYDQDDDDEDDDDDIDD